MLVRIFFVWLLFGMLGPMRAETVWMDLDQAALDAAYDQSVYAANLAQVVARFSSNSEAIRQLLGAPLRLDYGDFETSALDVYPTKTPNAPIFVFIHGGGWKLGLAKDNAHPAEAFVRNGVNFVVPDFSPVQDYNGNLIPMRQQLEEALVWIYRNAMEAFGGDPQRIYISGFSSGAHLASTLLYVDWTLYGREFPSDLIKGAVLCSGMYDLAPVALSARSDYVDFTPESIALLSAIRHTGQIRCPVVLAYGTEETPEFKRQTKDFAVALAEAGVDSTLLVGENYNHFEIIETLANPYGLLGRAALQLIKKPVGLETEKSFKPTIQVQGIAVSDLAASSELMQKLNTAMRLRHKVPLFVRAYIATDQTEGNQTEGKKSGFELMPAQDLDALQRQKILFEEDPELSVLRDQFAQLHRVDSSQVLKAVRFDGTHAPGWLFNTLLKTEDEAILIQVLDQWMESKGLPFGMSFYMNVFAVIEEQAEYSHLVSLNFSSAEQLSRALADSVAESLVNHLGSVKEPQGSEIYIVRQQSYSEL